MSKTASELLELLREAEEESQTEPTAGLSTTETEPLSANGAEVVGLDEDNNFLDPEVEAILNLIGEEADKEEELESRGGEEKGEDEEEKEEKDEDEDEDDKDSSDEDAESDFNDVDSLKLDEDELKEVMAQLKEVAGVSSDESEDDQEEKEDKEKEDKESAEGASVDADSEELPGTDELSKQQKFMIRRLFDSKVNEAVALRLADVVKAVEEKVAEKAKAVIQERDVRLNEQINDYLAYVVEEWTKKNAPALRTEAQINVAKRIFDTVRALVEECDIETVDARAEAVSSYEKQIEQLKKDAEGLVSEKEQLLRELKLREKALIIEEASKGLPISQVEEFKKVVAKLRSQDLDTFKENVEVVRASMTAKPRKSENIKQTNESLALQGGLQVEVSSQSEQEILAKLLAGAFTNHK